MSGTLQRIIVLPDGAGDALAVADVVQINNDDRQDVNSMQILLDFKLSGVGQRAQAAILSLAALSGTSADSKVGDQRQMIRSDEGLASFV